MSAAITKPDMDARHVSSETISSKSEIYGGITVYLKKFNKRIEVLNYITFFVILPKSRRTSRDTNQYIAKQYIAAIY